jgi:beta-N-acetylhexosaminidase
MNDELQSLARLPLFIATDQEGGNVARLRSPFTTIPSGKIIGDTGDPFLAHEAARVTGAELRHIGINTNFAPIADVNSNPANPVIGHRSFSHDARIAAMMVAEQVRGYLAGGVFSCAKHFPGHGDTSVDSHHDLPTLPFSLTEMEARELIPFRAAIQAGVPMVMTAHILFPALEPDGLPATMSHAILTGLLRERLGFNGLIVTDCLEMKAVSQGWGTARGAVLAAKAGADMLLVCHTEARQRETYQAL